MTVRKAGEVLDPLGVTLDVEDDQQVVEVVVVAKVVGSGEDAGTAVIVANSTGLDWVTQLGLFEAARQIALVDLPERDDG